jgi:hypothetical protein
MPFCNAAVYFKASWIFIASPLVQPGRLISGATKATIAQFQIPMFAAISAVLLFINGPIAIPHILLAFSNLCLLSAAVVLLTNRHLPWSMPANKQEQGTTVLRTLLVMLLLGVVSILHGMLAGYVWLIFIMLIMSVFANYFAFKAISTISWYKIRSSEF